MERIIASSDIQNQIDRYAVGEIRKAELHDFLLEKVGVSYSLLDVLSRYANICRQEYEATKFKEAS